MEHNNKFRVAIIADDFTGALDTGVQFVKQGAKTVTIVDVNELKKQIDQFDGDVLVIDTESRHLKEEESYEIVFNVTKLCIDAKIEYIFKKTDSVLRGNIEAEIKAVLDATNTKQIHFIPAYPQMNRYTKKGIQYLGEIPVSETLLGNDPFDPIRSSKVSDLFKKIETQNIHITKEDIKEYSGYNKPVLIYDAESIQDLKTIVDVLMKKSETKVFAGCAGLASALSEHFQFNSDKEQIPNLNIPFFVLSGSVNEVSKEQIEYESKIGNTHYMFNMNTWIDERNQIDVAYLDEIVEDVKNNKEVILDTDTKNISGEFNDEIRKEIAGHLGYIGAYISKRCYNMVIMIIGGDTVMSFLKKIKCDSILIVEEISDGTVLSKVTANKRCIWLISRSGGFGNKKMISEVRKKIGMVR